MTKKEAAYANNVEAQKKLDAYRGVLNFRENYGDRKRSDTCTSIEYDTSRILSRIGLPLKPATEKQLKCFEKTVLKKKDVFPLLSQIDYWKCNIYQMSELLDFAFTTIDCINSKYAFNCIDDFRDLDRVEKSLYDIYKKEG